MNNDACWLGHRQHHPSFSSVEISQLWWKSGHRGRVRISWSNLWVTDLGCGLCFWKSLGHGIWAILHLKMPWYNVKKIHPLFHLAQPKYPYILLKYPSKNGVFEMWQYGYLPYWYLSMECNFVKKNPSKWNNQFSIYVLVYPFTYVPTYICTIEERLVAILIAKLSTCYVCTYVSEKIRP